MNAHEPPILAPDTSEPYLIWSHEHRAWWRTGRLGYTPRISEAGHYSRTAAIAICADAVPGAIHLGAFPELPVRLADVTAMLRQPDGTPYVRGGIGRGIVEPWE